MPGKQPENISRRIKTMGLRIQNNIAAMNAHRQLTISDSGMAKSLERLSSGYRINKAADDAAGLSISQAFRADIASFKVAARNASEASSLLQVAEGAADQIGNMLTRLKELATQAASANAGSNLDKINAEKAQLLTEIDKIAQSTEYADVALINGSYGVAVSTSGGDVTTANGFGSLTGMKAGYSYVINVIDTAASKADVRIDVYNSAGTAVGYETVFDTSIPAAGSTANVDFNGLGLHLKINSGISEALAGNGSSTVHAKDSGNSTFQVGAENSNYNQISISLGELTTASSGLNITGIDLSTASTAQTALDTIDTAIGSLNTVRGNIGAYVNQLSYHSANLATTIENVQAAESVIRDVDMASEMTNFTKNQILMQAGTAMLAQANMAPQQVLSLFG
jgi:flagellin